MVSKMRDLPCLKCPVLAMCIAKKNIDCSLLIDFLTKYQRIARYPMWGYMLAHVRATLRGDWCVVGVNDRITHLEKDREIPKGMKGIYHHNYNYNKRKNKWKEDRHYLDDKHMDLWR
jgi:hypothetical protein